MQTYESLRGLLQTGDLLQFSGNGGISTGIKCALRSKWSHVGIVVTIGRSVFCWESTTLSGVPDVELGRVTQGVQLVLLSERLRTYPGGAAVRRLIDWDRTPEALAALERLRIEVRGRPYEQSKMQIIRSAWDGPFGANTRDLSSLFCSELVAEAYQVMGVLDREEPSSEYTPADFSSEKSQQPPGLLRGCFMPEMTLRS